MARGQPLVRQWNLLKTLQAHRFGVPIEELSDRLGVSRRQVQRDLRVLRDVGFPVEHEDRDFGKRFWKLSPHFVEREGLVLSLTETISLYLARQMLSPLAGTPLGSGLTSAFEKIQSLLPEEALVHFEDLDETLFVKPMATPDLAGRSEAIAELNRAVDASLVTAVRYHSASKGREWEADFRPYGLVYFGTNLYAIGHLEPYGEVRTLKVARIREVRVTDRRFERPEDFSLEAYLDGSFGVFSPGTLRTIEVRLTGWAAVNVREHTWHGSQEILQDTPEGVVVRFRLSDTREFTRWLLGYGARAEVLAPADLRDRMRAELCDACRNYDEDAAGSACER